MVLFNKGGRRLWAFRFDPFVVEMSVKLRRLIFQVSCEILKRLVWTWTWIFFGLASFRFCGLIMIVDIR